MRNKTKRIVTNKEGKIMRDEELKCDENGKHRLLTAMVMRGGSYRFSSLWRWSNFPQFKTEYQLRKAIKELIAEGLITEGFKGYNRYGYAWYKASKKAVEQHNERNKVSEDKS